ncbi:copper resistance protein B [Lysobacter sp. BMK333-48F3]|uniref:copper resistance protein B n=1 Tax=Lysobacter sp. BMK333-48F3 TaxID=2867962 RepID=UPI001C8B7AC4|nr:copper resistance protein B [Lysobacter sp. BMK333-48F3]MBX9403248.1 copper resistance protein B [Lysobacter sp. BMK333-48F3]
MNRLRPHVSALSLALCAAALAPGFAAAQSAHAGHAPPPAAAPATQSAEADRSQMDHSKMGHGEAAPAQRDRAQTKHGEADHSTMDHSQMNHGEVDHSQMDHSKMGHGEADRPPAERKAAAAGEPREPIPVPTDADRAAAFPPLQHHMQHAPAVNHYLVFNRLESVEAEHGSAQAWEAQGWIGTDTDRLWLRSEGEREHGATESADLEVLYGRAISPWWDAVAGLKHDFRPESSQTWAAFGVQGLSPYKFEVAATAYIGESGRTALNLEAEYELLLTNRLILQPLIEVDLNGKDDARRGVGRGLSTVEAGLRLRYEFNRHFAPYIGLSRERAFGDTADYRRADGEDVDDTRFVAGIRLWF